MFSRFRAGPWFARVSVPWCEPPAQEIQAESFATKLLSLPTASCSTGGNLYDDHTQYVDQTCSAVNRHSVGRRVVGLRTNAHPARDADGAKRRDPPVHRP